MTSLTVSGSATSLFESLEKVQIITFFVFYLANSLNSRNFVAIMVNRDHICIERCDTGFARHCQIVGELCLNGEHGHRLSIVQVYLTLPSACTVFVGKNREAHASSCNSKSGKFQKDTR